jgi:hypothetical protein
MYDLECLEITSICTSWRRQCWQVHLLLHHSSALACATSSVGLVSSSSILSTSASGTCSLRKSIIVCFLLLSPQSARSTARSQLVTARARLETNETKSLRMANSQARCTQAHSFSQAAPGSVSSAFFASRQREILSSGRLHVRLKLVPNQLPSTQPHAFAGETHAHKHLDTAVAIKK